MLLPTGWEKIFHVIINIIIVSIPEELFVVMFTLILLRQFDFLESKKDGENEFKKVDIARVFIIVLFIAILTNVMRYFLNVDPNISFIITLICIFISIVLIYQLYWSIVDIFKTFVFTVISLMVLLVTEMVYVPIILSVIGKTIEEINSSIVMNFLLSLPSRLIQYSIVAYLLLRKSTFLKATVFKIVTKSKTLMTFTIIFLLYNLLVFAIIAKFLIFDKILSSYPLLMQMLITVVVMVFPLVNLALYLSVIFYNQNKECQKDFIVRQDLEATIKDMKRFAKNKNYDIMDMLIYDLEEDVKRVYREK